MSYISRLILGLGISIPSSIIVIATVITKCKAGADYKVDLDSLGFYYVMTLLGIMIIFI